MIFNVTGGGGTSLNFKVVGGTTAPGSPTENTIWVNTDVAIPSWAFSATEPESPVAGMVWIPTGTSSNVGFNALKKNDIQVYPAGAEQYIGSEWVRKEAKTYQGGEWVEWVTYLYNSGDPCEHVGGAWIAEAKRLSSSDGGGQAPTITQNTGNMVVAQSGAKGGIARKESPIDLTEANTLRLNVELGATVSNANWRGLAVWSSLGTYYTQNQAAYLSLSDKSGSTEVTLDVSELTGEHYIGFCVYGTQTLTVSTLALE